MDWWHRTLCAGPDRDMWTAESVAERRVAAHRCLKHCPVLADCAEKMAPRWGFTWHTATVAGVVYDHAGGLDKGRVPDSCRTCVTSETYDAYMQANSARALRRRADNLALCGLCGSEFVAHHPSARVCKAEACRQEYERVRTQARRAREAART